MRHIKARTSISCVIFLAALPLILSSAGCGKSPDTDPAKAQTPAQAGSGLDQAFQSASAPLKESASLAAEAMRKGEYEKAIVSLHTARQATNITLEQGLAIHSSMVTLERDLINAIERGDENAKKAYELLRRTKRN